MSIACSIDWFGRRLRVRKYDLTLLDDRDIHAIYSFETKLTDDWIETIDGKQIVWKFFRWVDPTDKSVSIMFWESN